jgi:hypothetical protein
LDDILAPSMVADQTADDRVHGPGVTLVELVERRLVPLLRH